jgi:release factor glutamine methyltransferase
VHAHVIGARERLIRAGIPPDHAGIDAEVLARYVLGWDRAAYLSHRDEPIASDAASRFHEAIAERQRRVPVAYITGTREFWGLDFLVTPAVLIPRPETELVVDEALRFLKDSAGSWQIADVGTGSGCLAVSLARELPHATIVATDISPEALAVARQNAVRHGVADRIHFTATSLMVGVSGPLDLIVANPPYIPRGHADTLSPDVRDHEPAVALFGHGHDGLDDVRALLRQASARLGAAGRLLMEFGFGQADAVRSGAQLAGLVVINILRDLQGHERTLVAARRASDREL